MASTRILVVEDDTAVRNLLVALLRDAGYRVAEAEDGERAMDLAATFRPRLALVDGGLPGMDGRTVARRLRQMGEVGIIFVPAPTGSTMFMLASTRAVTTTSSSPSSPRCYCGECRPSFAAWGSGPACGRWAIWSSTRVRGV